MTAQELIKSSLRVIGVLATGETPTDDELSDGLEALHFMVRGWNAQGFMIHRIVNESFTLTGGTADYSIGSGGDFATVRPVRINGGWIRIDGIDHPLTIIDEKKYRDISLKSSSGTPQWLYYNALYSRGWIYLYPVPSSSVDIYLDNVRPLLEPTGLTSDVDFAPEYDECIKFNLAIRLAPEYGRPIQMDVAALAADSMNKIKSLNASMQVQQVRAEMFALARKWNILEG